MRYDHIALRLLRWGDFVCPPLHGCMAQFKIFPGVDELRDHSHQESQRAPSLICLRYLKAQESKFRVPPCLHPLVESFASYQEGSQNPSLVIEFLCRALIALAVPFRLLEK